MWLSRASLSACEGINHIELSTPSHSEWIAIHHWAHPALTYRANRGEVKQRRKHTDRTDLFIDSPQNHLFSDCYSNQHVYLSHQFCLLHVLQFHFSRWRKRRRLASSEHLNGRNDTVSVLLVTSQCVNVCAQGSKLSSLYTGAAQRNAAAALWILSHNNV